MIEYVGQSLVQIQRRSLSCHQREAIQQWRLCCFVMVRIGRMIRVRGKEGYKHLADVTLVIVVPIVGQGIAAAEGIGPARKYVGKSLDDSLVVGWNGIALSINLLCAIEIQLIDANVEQLIQLASVFFLGWKTGSRDLLIVVHHFD